MEVSKKVIRKIIFEAKGNSYKHSVIKAKRLIDAEFFDFKGPQQCGRLIIYLIESIKVYRTYEKIHSSYLPYLTFGDCFLFSEMRNHFQRLHLSVFSNLILI